MNFGSGELIQVVVSGLAIGGVYGLVGLGLVLVLQTTSIANFAQGEIGLIGAFVSFAVLQFLPFDGVLLAAVGVVVGVVFAALVGFTVESTVVRRMSGRPLLSVVVMTLGVFYVLRGTVEIVWGSEIRQYPALFGDSTVNFGPAVLSLQQLGMLIVCCIAAVALFSWLRWTRSGLAARAVVANSTAAELYGVPIRRQRATAWAVAGGLSGLAGVLIAPTVYLTPYMMADVVIFGFVAATLGGLENLLGTFVGALVLGVLSSVAGLFISGGVAQAITLAIVIVVLMVRPSGLMGRARVHKF